MLQAILVGGPLHGALLPLEADNALMITPDDWGGDEFLYVRCNDGAPVSADTALFVHGHPSRDELTRAIEHSASGRTTSLRELETNGRLRIITLGN